MKRYIKAKSHKHGVKLYKLSAAGGYVVNFTNVYSGNEHFNHSKRPAEFVRDYLFYDFHEEGRTLFCDNFYSFYQSAKYLLNRKAGRCGTQVKYL